MSEKLERITLFLTIVASVAVSILDLIGLLDTIPWLAGNTSAITLLVVALIASYLVSERFGKLERIENSIIESSEKILASLVGVKVRTLSNAEEAFEYMSERILKAEKCIDHAAIAPSIARRTPYATRWEQAIAKVLKNNKVIYRYVVSFSDRKRWERVKLHLANPDIQKYYVKYYDAPKQLPPQLSFVLIDDCEVIMHYPYTPGQPEVFLSIIHPDIVALFTAYYRALWEGAIYLPQDGLQDLYHRFDAVIDNNDSAKIKQV